MEIRLKLTLQFSLLVAFLLLAILSFNYLLAYRFAQESFFDRLKQRAILIAEFQGDSPDHHHVNSSLSRNLLNESVRSYHENGKLLFSYGWSGWKPDAELLASMNSGQEFSLVDGAAYSICFPVKAEAGTVWILASATDEVGSSKLRNLAQTMFISLLVFLVFVILAGQYLSGTQTG